LDEDSEDPGISTPSSYALWSNDGKHTHKGLAEICHATMRYRPAGKYDQLVTAVPNQSESSLSYLRALISGPFKNYSQYIILDQWVDGNYILRITDLDNVPASVVYNFCIASRAPIEFEDNVDAWAKLVDLGVEPNLAFLISGRSLSGHTLDDVITYMGTPSTGHWWFNTMSNWDMVIKGNPLPVYPVSYKAKPSVCIPCNDMWGNTDPRTLQSYTNKPIRELMEKFK
jgi:hypothetical protein